MKGFNFGFGFTRATRGFNFTGNFLFNGYAESIPGHTYTGGAIWIKDYLDVLRETPSDVIPSGGYWNGSCWQNVSSEGATLHPYVLKYTSQGTIKDFIDYPLRTDSTAYIIGDRVSIKSGDAELWIECKVAGTSHTSAPTINISDIDSDIAEGGGTVVWTVKGYHTLSKRYFSSPGMTNKCIAPASPSIGDIGATATVASPTGITGMVVDATSDANFVATVVQSNASTLGNCVDENSEPIDMTVFNPDYMLYRLDNSGGAGASLVYFSGAATAAIHTASIFAHATTGTGTLRRYTTSTGEVAVSTSSLTRVSMTATMTASDYVAISLPAGAIVDVFVPNLTETPAVMAVMEANTTRAANILNAPWPLDVNWADIGIDLVCIPKESPQFNYLSANVKAGGNWIGLRVQDVVLTAYKLTAGLNNVNVAHVSAINEKIRMQGYWNTTGFGLRASIDGGAFSSYSTHINNDPLTLSNIFNLGHRAGITQFHGFIPTIKVFPSKTTMEG